MISVPWRLHVCLSPEAMLLLSSGEGLEIDTSSKHFKSDSRPKQVAADAIQQVLHALVLVRRASKRSS